MSTGEYLALAGYAPVVLLGVARLAIFAYLVLRIPRITPRSPKAAGADAPLVSILVPARDEAGGIAACVRALLDQDYPNFEVLVIDDRSRDETAAIVAELARGDARLRLVRIDELPEGWTGKTHALDVGVRQAKGDWLLFVDADTRLAPACVATALADALTQQSDLLSVLPAFAMESFWEHVVQPLAAFCLMLLHPILKVNRDGAGGRGFANGQFLLARRSAYDATGGHAAVKEHFVEDIHLARSFLAGGFSVRVVRATDFVRVRMYSNLKELVNGWSRILYASVDGRPFQLWRLLFDLFLFGWLSHLAVATALALILTNGPTDFSRTALALGSVHLAVDYTIMAWFTAAAGGGLAYVPLRLLSVIAVQFIVVRAILLCRTRRVIWRDTAYSHSLQRS